jgi:hypothetical protein
MDPMSLLSLYGGGGGASPYSQAVGPTPGGGIFGNSGFGTGLDPRRGQALGQMGLGMMQGRGVDPRLAMQAMLQQQQRRRRRPGDPGYDPAVDGPADPYAQQAPWWQQGGTSGQAGGGLQIGSNRY